MAYKDPIRRKEYNKAWYEANKESKKAYMKAWYEYNKESAKARKNAWRHDHKEQCNAYQNLDLNTNGETKHSIRIKSLRYLRKSDINIPGYEIHHCFGYEDPSKFIYISKSLHLKIHQYLRDNNIDASTYHYEYIKHLLDDSAVVFGLDDK